jgi:plastocyanin
MGASVVSPPAVKSFALRGAAAPLLAAAALACGGYSSSTSPNNQPPATRTVQATPQNTFDPASTSVAVNGKVTFQFGTVTHNVTFDDAGDAALNIGDTQNASVERQFAVAGTHAYHCTLHSGMNGTINVVTNSGGDDY